MITTEDLRFTEEVKSLSIYGLGKFLNAPEGVDVDDSGNSATVKFHVDFDIKNYGFRGIDIYVDSVVTCLAWEVSTYEWTPEEIAALKAATGGTEFWENVGGKIELDTSHEDFKEWEIKSEMKISESGAIFPEDVEIDFNNKTITIS